MTEQLRHDDFIQSQIKDARNSLKNNTIQVGKPKEFKFGLGGWKGVKTLIGRDIPTIATGGRVGNLTSTFLGSYNGHYKIVKNDPVNRTALVEFHVYNETGAQSATRIPVLGYKKGNKSAEDLVTHRKLGVPGSLLNDRQTGPGHTIKQNYDWYEQINY